MALSKILNASVTDSTLTGAKVASSTITGTNISTSTLPNLGRRNLIMNGDMQVSQRNGTSSITPADTNYTVDRWRYTASQASKFTFQQNTGSTPPVGFKNYMGFTVASAVTVGNGDYFAITQRIEGNNVSQLELGTANAKTITLSFLVRSSLTGTFGGALRGASFGRSYPFTYSISSANTWESKTITIAGDTSGTYQTDNTTGLEVIFGLGVGSTNSGTAGAWTASGHFSATGAVSVVGTSSATWYCTGVQLEVADEATPFEHRSYGEELNLCQRYFEKGSIGGSASFITTTVVVGTLLFATTKRANPAVSYPTAFTVYVASSVPSLSGHTTSGASPSIYGFMPRATCATNHHTKACVIQNGVYIADSEL